MNTITPEEANEYLSKLLEDEDSPEQTPPPKLSIPWQETPPTSWSAFLTLMIRFTSAMDWELDYDTVEDMSLVVFGHEEPSTFTSSTQLSEEEIQSIKEFILS